jgi:hypothetical protein
MDILLWVYSLLPNGSQMGLEASSLYKTLSAESSDVGKAGGRFK